MPEALTSAPVLSTPDNHILTEVEPAIAERLTEDLSEDQFKIQYEIDRTIKEIKERKWRRVALQFPDHMLTHSARVYQLLARGLKPSATDDPTISTPVDDVRERTESLNLREPKPTTKLTILGDTSYGSCCVDEIAAEHIDADAVVHYGRACLSPTTRLPVLHIYTQAAANDDSAFEGFLGCFPNQEMKVIVTADMPYASHVRPLVSRLIRAGYSNIYAADIVHNPSSLLPNRTVPEEVSADPSELSQWCIYHIAEPPTALLLTMSSKVRGIYIHDPSTDSNSRGQAEEARTAMLLRRRYGLVTSMNTVSTWGILINTLSVKNYLDVVEHVKRQIESAGKKSYLFVVGKLNAAKVANFSDIGGWVVIGCWESSLIDSKDFFRPILTPFELGLALASDQTRVWTGAWRSDFQGVLEGSQRSRSDHNTLSPNGTADGEGGSDVDSEEESAPPEFDLRTGRYVSQTRPLDQQRLNGLNGVTRSQALTKRAKGEILVVNGVASPAAEFLAHKRTWKGLGSDFEVQYEDEEVEGALIGEGRSGLARSYAVGQSVRT